MDWFRWCKPKPKTSVMAIYPYKDRGGWFFDDEKLGIIHEAFVAGMPAIIERITAEAGLKDAEEGFCCLFSPHQFPTAQGCLIKVNDPVLPATGGSAWYKLNGTNMTGWLCPCLLNYFPEAPNVIWFAAL